MLMQPLMDPAFPLLADALDPERAGAAFMAALAGQGCPVGSLDCAIERSRVKRGRKAVIGYRLRGVDKAGHPFDQQAMIALWPQCVPENLKSFTSPLTRTALGPATIMVEKLAGQAWFFPNDRKVTGIAALFDPLPETVARGQKAADARIMHYVPEQGCTIRVALEGGAVFGKARADDRGEIATAVERAARRSRLEGVRLARVLHHDPARRIYWQSEVPGVPVSVSDIVARPSLWAPRLARAVNGFHAIRPPAGLKRLTSESLAQNLAARAARTAPAMPALASQVEGLARALDGARPGPLPAVVSHCDLHPANFLWDRQSFAIIDLDTCALAPAALDFGSLTASLVHAAIEHHARDAAILSLVSAMREAAATEAFDWFAAASLLGERLYRCGTRLKSPSLRTRGRLIQFAHMLLEAHHG